MVGIEEWYILINWGQGNEDNITLQVDPSMDLVFKVVFTKVLIL